MSCKQDKRSCLELFMCLSIHNFMVQLNDISYQLHVGHESVEVGGGVGIYRDIVWK